MPGKQTYAFTIREQECVNALFSKVQISESFDPDAFAPSPQARSYVAVWDTGATHSSISQRIVEDLGLAPSGKARVRVIGPKGGEGQSAYQSDTYLVNIVLLPMPSRPKRQDEKRSNSIPKFRSDFGNASSSDSEYQSSSGKIFEL